MQVNPPLRSFWGSGCRAAKGDWRGSACSCSGRSLCHEVFGVGGRSGCGLHCSRLCDGSRYQLGFRHLLRLADRGGYRLYGQLHLHHRHRDEHQRHRRLALASRRCGAPAMWCRTSISIRSCSTARASGPLPRTTPTWTRIIISPACCFPPANTRLTVTYGIAAASAGTPAGYSGTLTLSPLAAEVPEPVSWGADARRLRPGRRGPAQPGARRSASLPDALSAQRVLSLKGRDRKVPALPRFAATLVASPHFV